MAGPRFLVPIIQVRILVAECSGALFERLFFILLPPGPDGTGRRRANCVTRGHEEEFAFPPVANATGGYSPKALRALYNALSTNFAYTMGVGGELKPYC